MPCQQQSNCKDAICNAKDGVYASRSIRNVTIDLMPKAEHCRWNWMLSIWSSGSIGRAGTGTAGSWLLVPAMPRVISEPMRLVQSSKQGVAPNYFTTVHSEKLILSRLVKSSPFFMEHKCSLPCSHQSNYQPSASTGLIQVEWKVFRRWCITLWITGFLDIVHRPDFQITKEHKQKHTPWPLVRKRTIPTERSSRVGEIQCQLLRIDGCHVVSTADPHGR
jgi:hypothetical protein